MVNKRSENDNEIRKTTYKATCSYVYIRLLILYKYVYLRLCNIYMSVSVCLSMWVCAYAYVMIEYV